MSTDRTLATGLLVLLRVLLALALAVVPSMRPATAAVPVVVSQTAPTEENEEQTTGGGSSAVEWSGPPKGERRFPTPVGPALAVAPRISASMPSGSVLVRAADVDPFRNGLGSPFRC